MIIDHIRDPAINCYPRAKTRTVTPAFDPGSSFSLGSPIKLEMTLAYSNTPLSFAEETELVREPVSPKGAP